MELKKLTDAERAFLAAFGETPEQHQAQVLSRLSKTKTTSASSLNTKASHNRKVHESYQSIKSIQQALEDMTEPAIVWVPNALVFHSIHETCRCGQEYTSPGQLFVRENKELPNPTQLSRLRPLAEGGPVPTLPRLHKVVCATVEVCQVCYKSTGRIE